MAVWLAKKTTLAVWLAKKTIGCVAELTKVEHKNNNNHTCCGVSPGSGTSCGCFEGPGFSYRCFVQHLFHHVELFLFLFQCSTQLLLYLPLLLFLNSKQKSWQKIYTKKRGNIFYLPPLFFLNSKKELVRWLDGRMFAWSAKGPALKPHYESDVQPTAPRRPQSSWQLLILTLLTGFNSNCSKCSPDCPPSVYCSSLNVV